MTAPREMIQLFKLRDQACAEWVKVDIADQLKEIGFFFTNDRFVTILEQVTGTKVPTVEITGVSGQQTTHKSGQLSAMTSQKKVTMIRNERPGIAVGSGIDKQSIKTRNEVIAIIIVTKYLCAFNATDDDMLQ
jgi:hypothetical protein